MVDVTKTSLPGVVILEPKVFEDKRGFFFESFNARQFAEATGTDVTFVQDNHSSSARGVLRGIHYQLSQPQGKLVRVIAGEVFDIAVDLQRHSGTFGQWTGVTLSAANRKMLWVPEGFGHGFLVTSERAEVIYKTTDYYSPAGERSIRWDDPELAIQWPTNSQPIVSGKDQEASLFHEAEVFD